MSHADRIKRNWWDDKEGSLVDKIKKQEALCRRLKEIEVHVESELKDAKAAAAKADKIVQELKDVYRSCRIMPKRI